MAARQFVLICSPLGIVDVLLHSLRKSKWCFALWKRPAVFLYFFLSMSSLSLGLVVSSEAVMVVMILMSLEMSSIWVVIRVCWASRLKWLKI